MKIITSIAAAILFVLAFLAVIIGFLFILGSGSPDGAGWWLTAGILILLVGFVFLAGGIILVIINRRKTTQEAAASNVTYKIDLPGSVSMDTIKCKSCGGVLSKENIEMVAGAPVVVCPYCKTTYQLTEEPKW